MKFPYVVNHNGVYYAAGQDVPVEELDIPAPPEEPETPIPDTVPTAKRGRPARAV